MPARRHSPPVVCPRCRELLLDRLEQVVSTLAEQLGLAGLGELLTALFPEEHPSTSAPGAPALCLPGTHEKVQTLAARARAGQELHHDQDLLLAAPGTVPLLVRLRNGQDRKEGLGDARPDPDERPVPVGRRAHLPALRCKGEPSRQQRPAVLHLALPGEEECSAL
jgi:hypothetical protein